MPEGIDRLIVGFDRALRTLSGTASAARPNPAAAASSARSLTPDERRHAAGLMRVNHTGEVCAQALYAAQALVARDPDVRGALRARPRAKRKIISPGRRSDSRSLGAGRRLLNPLWYAGSFAIGIAAGARGRPRATSASSSRPSARSRNT